MPGFVEGLRAQVFSFSLHTPAPSKNFTLHLWGQRQPPLWSCTLPPSQSPGPWPRASGSALSVDPFYGSFAAAAYSAWWARIAGDVLGTNRAQLSNVSDSPNQSWVTFSSKIPISDGFGCTFLSLAFCLRSSSTVSSSDTAPAQGDNLTPALLPVPVTAGDL